MTSTETQKQYYRFLDSLRESGQTNMFGAAPYLAEMFDLDRREARKVLKDWMAQFGKEEE